MFVKYATSDNAFGRLGAAVNTTQTTITLSSHQNLPTGAAVWIATLTQYANDGTVFKFEKVKVTNNVSGTLTVVRGFDGTTAETFNQDDYVFLNVVSEIIKDLQEQAENPVKWEFKNQSGSTIPLFRVVRATGALGASGKMTAAPFIADGSVPQIYALGISRTDVANGGDGEALAFGKIHGINTTGSLFSETWAEGDVLYCSPTTAGGLTKVKPGPAHLAIPIAMVINVHANNGTIAVRVPDTYKLGELHDVAFTSVATGDSVFRHASGYWYNAPAYTKAQIDAKINAVNGIAGLNGSGQLDPSVLPVLATTETVIVADQTAMLALTSGQIQKGDVAVQSGGSNAGTRWLFGGGTISDINNWILLADTTPEWSVIANKPITVAGYGISDAVTIGGTQTISGVKTFTATQKITANNAIELYSDDNKLLQLRRWGSSEGTYGIFTAGDAIIYSNSGGFKIGLDSTGRFAVATGGAGYERFAIESNGVINMKNSFYVTTETTGDTELGLTKADSGAWRSKNRFVFQRYRGTMASKVATNVGDVCGAMAWRGYDGTNNKDMFSIEVRDNGTRGLVYMQLADIEFQGTFKTDYFKTSYSINISNTNLDNLVDGGFYDGSGMTNAPDGDWWYIQHYRHNNYTTTGYMMQVATSLTKTPVVQYVRCKNNGTWTSRQKTTP